LPLTTQSSLVFVNGAKGGQTAGSFAKSGGTAWSNVTTQLSRKGKKANDVGVVWVLAVNRATTSIDPYVSRLTQDLNGVANQIRSKFPGALILMSGLHHEVFAPLSSKQPEPYAWESDNVVNSIVASNSDVIWGPYLWNPAPKARSDGFNVTCDMIDTDPRKGGVHLNGKGSQYLADNVVDWFQISPVGKALWGANGSGGGSTPPPSNSCPDRVANHDPDCRIRWDGLCQCRN